MSPAHVGFASGCFVARDYDKALATTLSSGGTAFEVGCYRTEWTTHAHRWVTNRTTTADLTLSIHTPRFAPRSERRVAHVLGATGVPLVLHADRMVKAANWRELGPSVLVENLAHPNSFGSTPATLDEAFAALPEASFCLDVSHAFAAGGTTLVEELAYHYRHRLAQLHVGCTGVPDRPDEELPGDADLVAIAFESAGHTVPVIIERPLHEAPLSAVAALASAVGGVL